MVIPERVERAIGSLVTRHLAAELGKRGLLLEAGRHEEEAAEAAKTGMRLLDRAIRQWYASALGGNDLVLEFDDERTAARVKGALAFGAATATVLASGERSSGPAAGSIELLSAVFTLGIGLVDGLCDGDAEAGRVLLGLVQARDLAGAAEEWRVRGWLRESLPAALAFDATLAFTVDVIEAFFETLHAAYPGDAGLSLRRDVGAQLEAALEAERSSVDWSADSRSIEQLLGYSRRTSVLPFEIIQTLARGSCPPTQPSAGTLLGEAMWRIDDLVDLCQDARCGALNGVLIAACEDPEGRYGEAARMVALEHMLTSTSIPDAAADAAVNLSAGLELAGVRGASADGRGAARSFLYLIQVYAGIEPA